ncbi:O-antigen ligase family protein [Staphylococcus sp. NRL 16/872]|uniref:O-antigen ligase family protein n=1 Tax=Staphylococcus sp. NRL 16/872 TaxID=2930131 RepID=UPI001FB4FB85|nr:MULTISPECIES: O-antigen ligase family protein [unclassified Staphylococcus]MCJ1655232.1 O-antigen ligase family protein [Staphylococcus sp. NRL 21/187]MCJ1661065.1 O-antigen ligase family protein [Staphylococcus sp. NRL 18/288]MCJ1666963.1 O-antigen ligase family protein [Staphylococcus sp. NRL 19/737]WEN69435.1 O-antigen ligase family protein [Staphylococcus sp. NRL 16/872]
MMRTQENSTFLNILLIGLAIFIQQSFVIAGINISIADFIILILFIYIVINHNKVLEINSLVIFILVLYIYRILMTVILGVFDDLLIINLKEVLATSIKFAFVVIYLLIGSIIFKLNNSRDIFLKSYVISSVVIGMLCVFTSIFKTPLLTQLLFFDELRSKGLMNDPNYFAMTQIISLILVFKFTTRFLYRLALSFMILLAIFTTGSKTASIIILLLFFCYCIVKLLNRNIVSIVSVLTVFSVALLCAFYMINFGNWHMQDLDLGGSFNRMTSIFKEGTASINESGSDRSLVWLNAISLIKYTLGFGLGLFDYIHVGTYVNGVSLVAHNTYLQIFAEWGILFGLVFIFYLIYLLFNLVKFNKNGRNLVWIVILLILMVYFMTVSFNNSRYVAFVIGTLIYIVQSNKTEGRQTHEE